MVHADPGKGGDAANAGHLQNMPGALPAHNRQRCLRNPEGAEKVGFHLAAHFVLLQFFYRPELAEKETKELAIIETYLPAAASEADMDAAIAKAITDTSATSIKQMGDVVKAAKTALEGKTVDGKALSDRVRARLA